MVATILLLNTSNIDVSDIILSLKREYYNVVVVQTFERATHIVKHQVVNAVLLTIPPRIDTGFCDFFAVFRHLCKVIPIIALTDTVNFELDIDAVVDQKNIDRILMIAEVFCKINSKFLPTIASDMRIDHTEINSAKVVACFCNGMSIIDSMHAEQVNSLKTLDNYADADLFVINYDHSKAINCCVKLRLLRPDTPIVFVCSKKQPDNKNMGYTTVINKDDLLVDTFLLSLIKYKKIYDVYVRKIQDCVCCAAIDTTTYIYNRTYFDNYIKGCRVVAPNTAILMIDVDKFKAINDKFGHTFADRALYHICGIIKSCVRSSDVVARYGGDEFIVIMHEIDTNRALDVADRIRQAVDNTNLNGAHFSISVGVCLTQDANMSMQNMIEVADKFMYVAKQNGGNNVKLCS